MTKIIADISGNHGGSLERAYKLIRAAAESGCTMVKFQLYRPEDMPDLHEGDNEQMYRALAIPVAWVPGLYLCARGHGIPLFASVFHPWAVEELKKHDCPFIKLASPHSTKLSRETELDIIAAMSPRQGLIVSGRREGVSEAYRLYCPPGHPYEIGPSDWEYYVDDVYDGLSDHSTGASNAIWAIEHQAQMIEKHIKLDNNCVDAAFSGTPDVFRQIVRYAKS